MFYVREYRVKGVHLLSGAEVEKAVYPFLGPERTPDDVEKARAALESLYQSKGYKTVVVHVPPQQVKKGVVMLEATEEPVGRLRVRGSRYFSPEEIKRQIPSLAEGTVPDFSENGPVARELIALNQLPDRRITPTLIPQGKTPGTVDVDLNVKDTLPLHGSVELNNRYSADTTKLRVDGSVNYNNLWQAGHSIGFSFQLAPERLQDGEVFSGYYIARFPSIPWLGLMVQGTKQNSDVSTLGGAAVVGKGETVGMRALISLPNGKDFYQSIALGIDYKHYGQDLTLSGTTVTTPTSYVPVSAAYNANWVGKGQSTEANATVTFNMRGFGSDATELDNSRFKAGGNFIYLRGDISHTHDLPEGIQVYGRLQGQAADQPLLNTEQFSGGGLSTVRGYLESAALGDDGFFATLELRSPNLAAWTHDHVSDWRIYTFFDGGMLGVLEPLPEQQSSYTLASFGIGTKMKISDHFNGTLDLGFPLVGQGETKAWTPLVTFRVWSEF